MITYTPNGDCSSIAEHSPGMYEVLGSISCPTKEKNLQTATAHSLLLLSKESVLFHPFHNEALAPHAAGKLFLLIQSTSVYLQSQTTSHPAHNSPMTSHLTQKKIPSSKAITGKTLGDAGLRVGRLPSSAYLGLFYNSTTSALWRLCF